MTRFYNTVGLTGESLAEAKIKAGNVEGKVLEFFRERKPTSYTPSEVYHDLRSYRGYNGPESSIRRATTNLRTRDGLLVRTGEKSLGDWGIDNFLIKYYGK